MDHPILDDIHRLLSSVKQTSLSEEERLETIILLAHYLWQYSQDIENKVSDPRQDYLKTLIKDQKAKHVVAALTDQCFRDPSFYRTMDQVRFLLCFLMQYYSFAQTTS